MIAAFLVAMFVIWMFLKWFIPTTGDIGFAIWVIAALGIAYWLDSKARAT